MLGKELEINFINRTFFSIDRHLNTIWSIALILFTFVDRVHVIDNIGKIQL